MQDRHQLSIEHANHVQSREQIGMPQSNTSGELSAPTRDVSHVQTQIMASHVKHSKESAIHMHASSNSNKSAARDGCSQSTQTLWACTIDLASIKQKHAKSWGQRKSYP